MVGQSEREELLVDFVKRELMDTWTKIPTRRTIKPLLTIIKHY